MIITDLNYLEVVSEASNVVGGGLDIELLFKKVPVNKVKQNNVSVLNQVAKSTAVAITEKGDATAASNAENNAVVVQLNENN